jgi:signal transduction histidine kinase/DNA-binding response OmpR family regulator
MKTFPDNSFNSHLLVIIGGWVISILGFTVLFGWYTHNETLIQVSAAFVPMQYNTALGFVVSGLSFVMIRQYHAVVALCGAFVLFLGLLTLLQYIFVFDLGIDQLMMKHYISVATSNPGRMAPNTALCFFLTGIALVMLSKPNSVWQVSTGGGFLGALIFGLGVIALTGYAVGLETAYGWAGLTCMAVHTSAGFIFIGAIIASIAWQRRNSSHLNIPLWFPLQAGIGVVTIVISLWQALNSHNLKLIKKYGESVDAGFVDDALLIIGMILAVVVSLCVYLVQTAKNRQKELEQSNNKLVNEIDERKAAEIDLQKSEERFKGLFESSEISIWNEDLSGPYKALGQLRLEGVTDLRQHLESNMQLTKELAAMVKVIRVNKATLILFGAESENTFLDSIHNLISAATLDIFKDQLCAIWDKREQFHAEVSFKTFTGKDIIAIISFRIPETEIGFNSISVSIVDITEKKRLYEELDGHRHRLEALVIERTQQLEEAKGRAEAASRAKGNFLANMSHEIRTPMNAIIGLTHLLQRDDSTSEQAKRFEKIANASSHLLSIINDILDMSKIESGKLSLEQSDFHLDAIFDHIQSLFTEQARKKNIKIEIDKNGVPRWLNGDSTRLRQALLNYVSNAIKFTEAGTIFIRSKKLEQRDKLVLVRFEVQDMGPGIESKQLSRLFHDFEQVDSSTTRHYGGTGLGLSITRRLVELMGGGAGVESCLGQGSTFWFTAWLSHGQGIQLEPPPILTHDIETELTTQHSGAHVLLVDDNIINREVAFELLTSVGLTVDTAVNGKEAVDKVASTAYALVLMDIQMPEMDGLQATQLIRSKAVNDTLPILAMTANVFSEDRQACKEVGMNDFVAKPVVPRDFFSTISQWMPKNKALEKRVDSEDSPSSTVPNDQSSLHQQLASIAGINAQFGLNNVQNNAERYLQLLHQFNRIHSDDIKKMNDHLVNQQCDEVRKLTHKLKGSAGTLGLTQVQDAAIALENQLGNDSDDNITHLIEQVSTAQHLLHEALAHIVEHTTPKQSIDTDKDEIQAILKQLKPLLDRGDTQVNSLMHDFWPVLRRVCGDQGKRLEQQINDYDYQMASATLNELFILPK